MGAGRRKVTEMEQFIDVDGLDENESRSVVAHDYAKSTRGQAHPLVTIMPVFFCPLKAACTRTSRVSFYPRLRTHTCITSAHQSLASRRALAAHQPHDLLGAKSARLGPRTRLGKANLLQLKNVRLMYAALAGDLLGNGGVFRLDRISIGKRVVNGLTSFSPGAIPFCMQARSTGRVTSLAWCSAGHHSNSRVCGRRRSPRGARRRGDAHALHVTSICRTPRFASERKACQLGPFQRVRSSFLVTAQDHMTPPTQNPDLCAAEKPSYSLEKGRIDCAAIEAILKAISEQALLVRTIAPNLLLTSPGTIPTDYFFCGQLPLLGKLSYFHEHVDASIASVVQVEIKGGKLVDEKPRK